VSAPEESPVRVDGMTRRYGSLVAVSGVSFDVRSGEMFGLIGPDGAGKTTTLRVVLGLLQAHGGTVRTCGLDPIAQHRGLSQRVGYLSQRFSLYGDLTVDENIAFFAEIHGVTQYRERRDMLLDLVRMAPFRKRLADRLSGGMKQKLALACTLIHTPKLLVLDEPTTGVDPVSRRDFWRLLSRLRAEGLTILLTTPYLDEAERCQRVALMDAGTLLRLDTPEALRASARGVLFEVIARPTRRAAEVLRGRREIGDIEIFGERVHVTILDGEAAEAAAGETLIATALREAQIEVASIRVTVPSLEDVFIHELRARSAEAQPSEVSV
jgi:ABC-2 type transport system ATP-binding protein